MGRGLSQLQRDILDALPDYRDDMHGTDAPTRFEIAQRLGRDDTEASRVAVTRAVSRLYRRGLILHVWGFGRRDTRNGVILSGQRTGYARAAPEQVAAFRQRQQEFFARCGMG